MAKTKQQIADTFLEVAEYLRSGKSAKSNPAIGLMGLGSEHGEDNAAKAAINAVKAGLKICYIGKGNFSTEVKTDFTKAQAEHKDALCLVQVNDEAEGQKTMESMLQTGSIKAAVSMHYPFPVGVSTVGRVVTPAFGKQMLIANTTGMTSADRVEAMVLNAIGGIACAKALGIDNPTLGILNLDGARGVERALQKLKQAGLDFQFATSSRQDGGSVLRGNDVLQGSCDILVTDSLTGNVLTKMLSSFNTGGSFEAVGYGYGPGIGENAKELVLIVSRASGVPVVTNALIYAQELVVGDVLTRVHEVFEQAKKAGLDSLFSANKEVTPKTKEVKMPEKEPVFAEIPGIDVLEMEDVLECLWEAGIYAEGGMGCTGPIVRVSDANEEKARALLLAKNYIS